jgi:3-hydroxy-9,10-secoandrosta-1,3,5(10)-triene-9,17-dione monooxygenase
MSAVLQSRPSHTPRTADEVLAQVNALVHKLRARAPETERLRRMHPYNLRDLTEAGVFRLAMPTDVGGYQASDDTVAEVLAQISRGCPSTGWMCTIMLISNAMPALLADEAADEIYATPDLRITTTIAPTGEAVPSAVAIASPVGGHGIPQAFTAIGSRPRASCPARKTRGCG